MSGSATVAVRRTGYPQVDPRAEGLMQADVTVVPADLPVAEAERQARGRRARLVAARIGRSWAGASHDTLVRALKLGLDETPVDTVLWDTVVVPPRAHEVAVRRRLGPACPFVLVEGGLGPRGVVFRDSNAPVGLPRSVAARLEGLPPTILAILRTAGTLGAALGSPVAVVGGLVRDLLLDRAGEPTDLDLVVQGHAATLASRLAAELSGRAVEHLAFLTATVVLPDARRIDVATARRESYRAPGALPSVEAAALAEDLARRDFSLNALAVRLDPPAWGRLVDTTGGLADLEARRLRVLHPLSFVEDPTRILRAARLAVRLGCRIDPTTRRLATRAAELGHLYRALSADRLRDELLLALAEPNPAAVLHEAGQLGAWSLVRPGAVRSRRTARLVTAALAPRWLAGLSPDTVFALCLLALGEGSGSPEGSSRVAPSGVLESIRRARADAPKLLARLTRVRGPGAAYTLLDGVPEVTAAWARALTARPVVRRHLDRYLRSWRRMKALATGDDLLALGVVAGPVLGNLLRELRARQAARQVRNRAGALRWLAGAVARGRERRKLPLTRPGREGG